MSTNDIRNLPKFEKVMLAIDHVEVYSKKEKIFADVFESLIAAVYLDCGDMEQTWRILSHILLPYIEVYLNQDIL